MVSCSLLSGGHGQVDASSAGLWTGRSVGTKDER